MSDFTEDLTAAIGHKSRLYGCSLCKVMAKMSPDERQSLQTALNSEVGAKRLSVILKKHGYDVGLPSVSAHRNEGHTQ